MKGWSLICIKLKLLIDISKVWKKLIKDGYNLKLLEEVVDMLSNGEKLPQKYKNHPLKGSYSNFYDCHILPDWVLIYKIEKDKLVLLLFDTGTHADLLE